MLQLIGAVNLVPLATPRRPGIPIPASRSPLPGIGAQTARLAEEHRRRGDAARARRTECRGSPHDLDGAAVDIILAGPCSAWGIYMRRRGLVGQM